MDVWRGGCGVFYGPFGRIFSPLVYRVILPGVIKVPGPGGSISYNEQPTAVGTNPAEFWVV